MKGKGIRIVQSKYVQARLMHKGHYFHKHFGLDSPLARELAGIWLAEKRKEILMGKCGIEPELPRKRFKEVVPLFMDIWKAKKKGDGNFKHSPGAIAAQEKFFESKLVPYFGSMWFDSISPVDVENWRQWRINTGVLGTSVNREQVPLSAIFTVIPNAMRLKRIEAFKVPAINPCEGVDKAETRKRERIPTDYELKKLKLAFSNLGDSDGWEICKLALKSILSEKDLRKLELGATIDLERAKTGVPIHLPITVLQALNWRNWRKRWEQARHISGVTNLQFRDLRKKGGSHLVGKYDIKLVSQYFGHASVKTTERSYIVLEQEKMKPLAKDLDIWVESL